MIIYLIVGREHSMKIEVNKIITLGNKEKYLVIETLSKIKVNFNLL